MTESKNLITLRPGLLVGLSTAVVGGVQYAKKDINAKEAAAETGGVVVTEGAAVEAWETVKVTEDPEEHDKAVAVRQKARSLIAGVCIQSPFGLLCPIDKAALLDEAIREARLAAEVFNKDAKRSRVDVWVIRGQIVESDVDAARGIAAEIKLLLDEMGSGIEKGDAEKIRAAASKAKALGNMVDGDAGEKVREAILEARAAAREIVRRAKVRANDAELVVADLERSALDTARFAFLDFSAPVEVEGAPLPEATFRNIEVPEDAEVLDNASSEAALESKADVALVEKTSVEESFDADDEPSFSGPYEDGKEFSAYARSLDLDREDSMNAISAETEVLGP